MSNIDSGTCRANNLDGHAVPKPIMELFSRMKKCRLFGPSIKQYSYVVIHKQSWHYLAFHKCNSLPLGLMPT